jgi:drug/metabolite transporter (DMT)-like permease
VALPAILLLLISAGLHASWNLLGKRQNPTTAFMLVANTLGLLILAPIVVISWETLGTFPPGVWGLLAFTGICQAVYYVALAGAYRTGDLSLTYPLIRAIPVLLVAWLSLLLGQGEPPSRLAIAGMVLIVAGCLILPMQRFAQFDLRLFWTGATALALLAALGTVGYSITDDRALRLLRSGSGLTSENLTVTLIYAVLGGVSASLWGAAFVAMRREDRRQLVQMSRSDVRQAAIVGVFIFVGYSLVLVALALAPNVGYAVAFRQLSIPLGAIVAILVFKEPAFRPRLVGVALVFTGVLLVAVG